MSDELPLKDSEIHAALSPEFDVATRHHVTRALQGRFPSIIANDMGTALYAAASPQGDARESRGAICHASSRRRPMSDLRRLIGDVPTASRSARTSGISRSNLARAVKLGHLAGSGGGDRSSPHHIALADLTAFAKKYEGLKSMELANGLRQSQSR